MIAQFKHVKISGILTVVPEKEINIYDEVQYYGNSVKKVDRMRKMVGFYKRRVAENYITAADLGFDAARKLIEKMHLDKNSIDALVFVVQQPDVMAPATAYFIHQKLGLSDDCLATDINQGCVGWVYGLYMVSNMIESGVHKRVLLINADTPSNGIDPANRNLAPIFGDAGTATLLEFNAQEILSTYAINTKSYGYDALVSPFTGAKARVFTLLRDNYALIEKLKKQDDFVRSKFNKTILDGYMDGLAVFDFTINCVPENIKNLLDYLHLTVDDIGALCLHQANKQIVQSVAAAAGFDETDEVKVPYSAFENYGNNTMCSIPATLALLDKSVNKEKLLCSSFGNGLVVVSSLLNLCDTAIFAIMDFEEPDYVLTHEEYYEYWMNKLTGENHD